MDLETLDGNRVYATDDERHVIIEQWTGISLLWKVKTWGALLERVPPGAAQRLLRWADAVARRFPSLADVIIVGGRPR